MFASGKVPVIFTSKTHERISVQSCHGLGTLGAQRLARMGLTMLILEATGNLVWGLRWLGQASFSPRELRNTQRGSVWPIALGEKPEGHKQGTAPTSF